MVKIGEFVCSHWHSLECVLATVENFWKGFPNHLGYTVVDHSGFFSSLRNRPWRISKSESYLMGMPQIRVASANMTASAVFGPSRSITEWSALTSLYDGLRFFRR